MCFAGVRVYNPTTWRPTESPVLRPFRYYLLWAPERRGWQDPGLPGQIRTVKLLPEAKKKTKMSLKSGTFLIVAFSATSEVLIEDQSPHEDHILSYNGKRSSFGSLWT